MELVNDDEPHLQLDRVSKSYGEGARSIEVLHDVSLRVFAGEFVVLLGFSGSGKTTLISLLAGLQSPDVGDILYRGKPIDGPGLERGVVFQNYSLLPWMTVEENVELGVQSALPRAPRREIRTIAHHYISMVNLSRAIRKRPHELSGGMRQRVSLARTLAMNPDVLLMDEPLGALDALTRGSLQQEIARIWCEHRKTVVLVTNDVDEAILLADRVIPLLPGPRATIGQEFLVSLPRPRDRRELNHDTTFRSLRNEITEYLTEARDARRAARTAMGPQIPLPKGLLPRDLTTKERREMATVG